MLVFYKLLLKGWNGSQRVKIFGIGRNFKGENSFQSVCLHTVSSPCI